MMKYVFLLTLLISMLNPIHGQTPRIALVKPDGTTSLHQTLQAAYDAASDDDYIYLPGGQFPNLQINKRLHIYGAGSNIDSSSVTGITKMNALIVLPGAQGGSIEGIFFYPNQSVSVVFSYSNESPVDIPDNYSISYCYLGSGLNCSALTPWEGLFMKNNYIGFTSVSGGYCGSSICGPLSNCLIKNNIIVTSISPAYSQFSNNIFFTSTGTLGLSSNNVFNNNIFHQGIGISAAYSIFNNCVNSSTASGATNSIVDNVDETFINIFENPGSGPPYTYNVQNDYHVKPTSLSHLSGMDNTDRGIYGGSTPWIAGSIPSNPHIYFKNVADQTNSNGQLQIHFKVRTN